MRKAVSATLALALIILALLAVNARLRDREKMLEERLAVLENKLQAKSRPPAVNGSEPVAQPRENHVVSASTMPTLKKQPPKLHAESTPVARVTDSTQVAMDDMEDKLNSVVQDLKEVTYTLTPARFLEGKSGSMAHFLRDSASDDLSLSDAQKTLIDSLKKTRDMEAQVWKDMVKEIEDRYDQSIRQILDLEQLKKYDAQRTGGQSITFWSTWTVRPSWPALNDQ